MKKLFLLLFICLFCNKPSLAFYNDNELVSQNQLSTGILDFNLTDNLNNTADLSKIPDSLDSKYRISYQAGDSNINCNQLNILIKLDSVQVYDGLLTGLTDFTDASFTLTDNSSKKFDYIFTPVADTNCSFKLIYTAWQIDLPDPSSGFTSTKSIDFIINNTLSPAPLRLTQNLIDVTLAIGETIPVDVTPTSTPEPKAAEATPTDTPTPTDMPVPTDTLTSTDTPAPTITPFSLPEPTEADATPTSIPEPLARDAP
jgi:hypothetical protein